MKTLVRITAVAASEAIDLYFRPLRRARHSSARRAQRYGPAHRLVLTAVGLTATVITVLSLTFLVLELVRPTEPQQANDRRENRQGSPDEVRDLPDKRRYALEPVVEQADGDHTPIVAGTGKQYKLSELPTQVDPSVRIIFRADG
jgi:hypothetical protein